MAALINKKSLKRKRPQGFDIESLKKALSDRFKGVLICLSYSWGGLEQVAAQDAVDLAELGLKFKFICLKDSPIYERLKEHTSIELYPLDFRPKNYFDFKFKKVLTGLAEEGFNLVHTVQTTLLGSIVPWLWSNPKIVLLASRHIMSNHYKKNPLHRTIYRRLDGLIIMSNALKENVLETHPLKERQVELIRLGLDFNKFDPKKVDSKSQRQAWGIEPKQIVIGIVGRIDPAKGQATFIKAAAGLLKDDALVKKLKFMIVGEETRGSDTGYMDELKTMVQQFRIEENFIFSGHQDNIPEIMGAFDICAMPSKQEAFGLVAIEAMAMQCPIVISKGGSSHEIVGENEEFGYLVHPEDAFDLQRQLFNLLENPTKTIEMGKKAMVYVRDHYDKEVRIQKTLEYYEWCLRRRGL